MNNFMTPQQNNSKDWRTSLQSEVMEDYLMDMEKYTTEIKGSALIEAILVTIGIAIIVFLN